MPLPHVWSNALNIRIKEDMPLKMKYVDCTKIAQRNPKNIYFFKSTRASKKALIN